MFTHKFIKMFHSVQEIGPFSLFQNLALGKASTDDKCHFAMPWAKYFNIKLSAKFYQNIPNDLIVNFSLFSEFEPRQNFDQSQMSFDNLMGYILSIYQCVCKISSQCSTQFKIQGHFHFFFFSEFGARQNLDR